jgi:cytochrome c peroxidase
MHNGVFQDLTTVILFYDKYVNNERLINPETGKPWREPEISETVNLKALREGKELTERKIDALVAFLNILTDKRYEHLIPKQQ